MSGEELLPQPAVLFSMPRNKPVVAILADFPAWEVDPQLKQSLYWWHFSVWLSELRQALEEQDEYDIHWVLLDKRPSSPLTRTLGKQTFHILPRARLMVGLATLYAHDRLAVRRLLQELRPDIVHAWGTEDCHALCGADFPGRKMLSIQGLLNVYCSRAPGSRFARLHRLYERPAIRAYPLVTTESPWAAARVQELAPGCAPSFLEYAVEKRLFDVPRCLSPEPTCLYVGTDEPIKNLDTLLEAFSAPELSSVKLMLAGVSREQRPSLPPNIHPLGYVQREGIARLMKEAWCLVHSSKADTGPTSVKEARVVGLPVALTTECGSQQHVCHGKSGFILSPGDVGGFVRAVRALTTSRDTALSMGRHGWQECRRALHRDTMLSCLCELYRSLLTA